MNSKRRPLLAANWKQNLLWQDIEEYCETLRAEMPEYFGEDEAPLPDLLICPPLCYLGLLGALLEDSHVLSGSQLVSTEDGGAFTGEVSAAMVADLGCDYVIIGHSERRQLFSDNEERISRRIQQALEHDLLPILCVGEDLETRRGGSAGEYVQAQLAAQLEPLRTAAQQELVIAYEPIWAIGTGENAAAADAQQMAALIRGWITSNISAAAGEAALLLYGGSVKPGNISEYFTQPDIDGALIGGASLNPRDMAAMLRSCAGVL
ncbi:triose-phosphate isomerase [bacterium]|nr:triose-phosphate isomerase [bacterium]